jgi:anaerobic selenocysteine-containing dehydrogenase
MLDELPDRSVGLMILDGSDSGFALPSAMLRRKLIGHQGMLVALTSTLTPISTSADILLPITAPYESATAIATTDVNGKTVFGLTSGILQSKSSRPDAVEAMRGIVNASGYKPTQELTSAAILKNHLAAIAQSRRGTLLNPLTGTGVDVSALTGADDIHERMVKGERWVDESPVRTPRGKVSIALSTHEIMQECSSALSEPVTKNQLTVMPFGVRTAHATGSVSPIMSKVFQDTAIREVDGTVLLNPVTARNLGLEPESTATLRTPTGALHVRVQSMPTVMQGVAHVAVGPRLNGAEHAEEGCNEGILGLMPADGRERWRLTYATLDGGSGNG